MENVFIDGLSITKPSGNAPKFVIGKVSMNLDKLIPFLQDKANAKGWVNIDLLESKGGKLYFKLNEYKKDEPAPF